MSSISSPSSPSSSSQPSQPLNLLKRKASVLEDLPIDASEVKRARVGNASPSSPKRSLEIKREAENLPVTPNLKRKISVLSSESPETKRARSSDEEGAGSQQTPPHDLFRRNSSASFPAKFFRRSSGLAPKPFSLHLSLSMSQEIAEVVTFSPLDEKLKRNFEKALFEHGVEEAKLPDLSLKPVLEPLKLHFNSDSRQGVRPSMEDFHFHCAIEQGFLMGIYDGHGDNGMIAKLAGREFQEEFPRLMQENPYELKANFKKICMSAHAKVKQKIGGTTALTCFLDTKTNRLITATLGDSEAKIFRKVGNTLYCIPLSCVRDWSDPKDEQRAKEAFNDPEQFKIWAANDAKHRHFPNTNIPIQTEKGIRLVRTGVNVSRSIGDKSMRYQGRTATSQSPKVTLCQLLPGDLLVMACDGLWDFVKDQELIDLLLPIWDQPRLAQSILDYALRLGPDNAPVSKDNVSVICARAMPASADSLDESESLELTQPL